jgi:hypothetical protein
MPSYPRLAGLVAGMRSVGANASFDVEVLPYLIDLWLDDYTARLRRWDVVETEAEGFSYLFDVAAGRLVAAWGVSRGRHGGERDRSRMAGHPLSEGPRYHRGHAIPHTLGGPTDINLVAQLGSVNVGAFRPLERRAVATPGSLYFTCWKYDDPESQTPSAVEQGLLVPGGVVDVRRHANR